MLLEIISAIIRTVFGRSSTTSILPRARIPFELINFLTGQTAPLSLKKSFIGKNESTL
jgi:hypothetical protein